LSTRCTACCDRFTNGTQRDADYSRTAARSTRSTSRRTQSACRTDRHDEPSSPIADTPTSFTGQAIRTTLRLCTADDRYRWVNRSVYVGEGRLLSGGDNRLGMQHNVYRLT
jgi:hypothetical protein